MLSKDFTILSLLCLLHYTMAAGGNIPAAQINYIHNLLHYDEPFDFEYSLLEDKNVTMELLRLMQSNKSLGFSFASEWENIASSVDSTTRGLECFQQLAALVQGLGSNDLTSYKYFDSWGKIPAGILKGHFTEFGNFDECLNLKRTTAIQGEIEGKYCFAKVPVGSALTSSPLGQIFKLKIAVCMPAVCSAEEFDIFYKQLLKTVLNINIGENAKIVDEQSCKLRELPPLEPIAWFAVAVVSILLGAMAFSSVYDYSMKLVDKKPSPLLSAFSVQRNLAELLRIVPNSKSKNVIHCLNGIRCLSLVWVIYGHSVSFTTTQAHINTVDILPWERSVYSLFIEQGLFAVDSFFFLSGLLVSYLALREMERNNGKLNVPMMYLHRILRLTPMVALGILIYTALFPNLFNAPLWQNFSDLSKTCKENWWITLLYVQNYVRNREQCLGHTWYLGVDMQLYILSPLFLIALYKWKKKGVAGIVVLGLLLVGCLFTTMMINDYSYHIAGITLPAPNTMAKTYYPTHVRASPWIVGLLLGYYLHNNRHHRVVLPKFAVLLGWLGSFALIFTIIFAWYPQSQVNARHSSTLDEALFWSLGRVAWPLALAWIVFACINDYGGPINAFLSCPIWQPFARLSYCMYIWHIYIQGLNTGLSKTNTYFSSYNLTLRFWEDYGWSIILGTFMYLAFEAPLVNIEKILLPRGGHSNSNKTSSQRNLLESSAAKETSTDPNGGNEADLKLVSNKSNKEN